jgi:C-terminal processing protease CtpA/Prc
MEGGMRICQYLSDKTLYGGIMLSQAYWNKHMTAPSTAEYKNFKLMDKANYAWFKKEVRNGVEGLCLVTDPLTNTFKGKVFILTSKSTASASEPFVYTLQKENIATVIGEKTAGAVISMEYFYLKNLALTIPMLDYYTYDGKRLDKIGVEPTIKCDPKEALKIAINTIGVKK